MANRLHERISEVQGKLAALHRQREGVDRQIDTLKIQLAAYQEAEHLVAEKGTAIAASVVAKQNPVAFGGLTPEWAQAFHTLRRSKPTFTIDDIIDAMAATGHLVKRPATRSRLAHLVTKGDLKRVSEGVFEFPAG